MGTSYIFTLSETQEGLYQHLFGGIFRREGFAELMQYSITFGFLFYSWLLFSVRSSAPSWRRSTVVVGIGLFSALVFMTSSPWDELFVNLMHSRNFATEGQFSFLLTQPIEATVDFLLYFFLGCLGALGFPLVESALLMSLLGGVVCVMAVYRLGRVLVPNHTKAYHLAFPLLLIACPPLVYNAGQGFSTTWYAGTLLWAIYFLFNTNRERWGLVLLAVLPLIRIEGMALSLILVGLRYFREPAKCVQFGVLCSIPFSMLTLWRVFYFGSAIPLPVLYKSSFGSLYYMKAGVRHFAKDFLASTTVFWTFVCAVFYSRTRNSSAWRRFYLCLSTVFLLTLPYYISGGDWFPEIWARYLFPFTLLAFTGALAAIHFGILERDWTRLGVCVMGLILVVYLVPNDGWENLQRGLTGSQAGRGNLRTQMLSQVGKHLKATTPPDYVIASSELATIMYFAERQPLDLLGVGNPEIVSRPLEERPYLAFRRSNKDLVEKYQPEIVWPYDYTTFADHRKKTVLEIAQHLEKLHARYDNPAEIRFGGRLALKHLGYRQVTVCYDGFSTLYWVSDRAWGEHQKRLLERGFKMHLIEKQGSVLSLVS